MGTNSCTRELTELRRVLTPPVEIYLECPKDAGSIYKWHDEYISAEGQAKLNDAMVRMLRAPHFTVSSMYLDPEKGILCAGMFSTVVSTLPATATVSIVPASAAVITAEAVGGSARPAETDGVASPTSAPSAPVTAPPKQ